MLWKTPIHGRGWSSAVVADDQIWTATQATEDGKKMYAICVSLLPVKSFTMCLLFENETVQPDHHATNSYASPTPVSTTSLLTFTSALMAPPALIAHRHK